MLQNPALMIAGMVVRRRRVLLTLLMAKAMNRSVSNVVFTNFGSLPQHKQGDIKGSLKADRGRPTRASSCATPAK